VTVKPNGERAERVSFVVPSAAKDGRYIAVLKFAGCRDLPVPIYVTSPLGVEVLPITCSLGEKEIPLTVRLTNCSRQPIQGKLDLAVPGAKPGSAAVDVSLKAGRSVEWKRTVAGPVEPAAAWVRLFGRVDARPFERKCHIDSTYVHRAAGRPVIDGDLGEWKNLPGFRLDRIEQTGLRNRNINTWWTGPDDLSADVQVQWNTDYFYFAAEVLDDVHFQISRAGSTWLGDDFQIAFAGPDNVYYCEFDLAHTATGPEVYRRTAVKGPIGYVEGAKAATRRSGARTFYEVAIPWAVLPPLQPGVGKDIRFNFILNENDGMARMGWLECRPGVGSGKNTRDFPTWRLGGPPPAAGSATAGGTTR
jgi:hypothetical protein